MLSKIKDKISHFIVARKVKKTNVTLDELFMAFNFFEEKIAPQKIKDLGDLFDSTPSTDNMAGLIEKVDNFCISQSNEYAEETLTKKQKRDKKFIKKKRRKISKANS